MTAPSLDPAQKTTRQRTVLLATDRNQSVLAEITDGKHTAIAYSSYGKQSAQQPIATALGFNGQLRESRIGWYLLGNGYRAYNPVLMRFHSPDSWSPFGSGGLNAYMYCVGDPVNQIDPTGHGPVKTFLNRFLGQTLTPMPMPRPSVIVKNPNTFGLKRLGVIVENPKRPSPNATQLATGNNPAPSKIQNPISELIATSTPQSSTIKKIDVIPATPSSPPSQPMFGSAQSQAGALDGMPKLKSQIVPFHQPLEGGIDEKPLLFISALKHEIRNTPYPNPVVHLRRMKEHEYR